MKVSKINFSVLTKYFTMALVFVSAFTSCKKDSHKDSTSGGAIIEGKWTGNKGIGNGIPDDDLLLTIKAGGVIEETNTSGQVKGSGTWSLNGTTFKAHYQFKAPLNTIYTLNGTFDKATGKISGTWGFDNGEETDGTWYIQKN
jgi:hypothetical protein